MIGLKVFLIGLCAVCIVATDPMEDSSLFEGDMILSDDQKKDFLFGNANNQIPLAATKTNLWPKTIPYSMDSAISTQPWAVKMINAAIADYEKYTCLRFVKRTNEPGYLHFYRGGGCSSPVGYYRRPNRISLASGCWHKGVVMHEIAHSLGFYHEQSRPDRDNHVTIRWENIPDNMEYNFRKQSSSNIDSMSVPYDYESVMHYGKTAFGGGKITIQTKDPAKQNVIGNRAGFSKYDIQQMNLLYKCSGFSTNAPSVTTEKPATTGGVTTVKPATTTTAGCRDLYSACPTWKSKGFCTDDRYIRTMKAYCPKSCGYCTVVTTVKPATTPTAGCKDLYSACPSWKSKGFCTDDRYKRTMKAYCPKTCGYCAVVTTVKPATTPTAVVTTMKPATTPAAGCQDLRTSCPAWKRMGYCTDNRYKRYMTAYCKKSCGHCAGATTNAPVVTTRNPMPPTVSGNCGRPEIQQGRVIAGVDAKKGAWPWQILMLFNGRTMCGGSLVAPNWVVTAAHCVSGRESQANYFTVRVGEHITSTSSDGQHQDIQVAKIISHPSYSRRTINNDIALMKLAKPALFGKYVKPVCLPGQDQDVPVNTECFITGWGKIKHPGSMHHTLQQGKMPVVSKANCTNVNTRNLGIKITDQMVCAGHGGRTKVSGCHGDSGGPFVCQTGANGSWQLHGAVSWGSGRCDATLGYTVFARVAKFRSWIDQEIARN